MCLFIIVGDFMGAFWNACVTSADLAKGYVRGCVGVLYVCGYSY